MWVFEILEDVNYFYIISELLFEELSHRLLQRGLFSEKDAAIIFQQILMGLNYLHINNIVHRDIKLENVLMQTDNKDDLTLKITDFGFAKVFNREEGLTDILGSPLYMAPEIVQKKSYNSAVDIWAAGVLLHILLVGEPPYMAKTKKEIFKMIKKDKVEFNDEGWKNISKDCKSMVHSML